MVTNEHRVFVQAVVALARQHRMNGIKINFRMSASARMDAKTDPGIWEEVTADWSEGRHGVAQSIHLSTRAQQTIPEKAEQEGEVHG